MDHAAIAVRRDQQFTPGLFGRVEQFSVREIRLVAFSYGPAGTRPTVASLIVHADRIQGIDICLKPRQNQPKSRAVPVARINIRQCHPAIEVPGARHSMFAGTQTPVFGFFHLLPLLF